MTLAYLVILFLVFEVLFVVSDGDSYTYTQRKTITSLLPNVEWTISFFWQPPVDPPANATWNSYPHSFDLRALTLLEGAGDWIELDYVALRAVGPEAPATPESDERR